MGLKYHFCLLLVCLSAAGMANATEKKKKANLKLVTAYTRKIADTEQTNPPMAGTFVVIKWGYDTYPETIFWRGQSGWLTCNIGKAHKMVQKGKTSYATEEIMPDQVHKGDTLMLTPVTGGRFPIPAEIPAKAKNTLFFKTGGSATWSSFAVSPISKK